MNKQSSVFNLFRFGLILLATIFLSFGGANAQDIVAFPLGYFILTVAGYVKEGFTNRTENIFAERNFITTWFMYSLIAGEIAGFALVLGGFFYTQFLK